MKGPNRNCKVGNQNRAWIIYENKKKLKTQLFDFRSKSL